MHRHFEKRSGGAFFLCKKSKSNLKTDFCTIVESVTILMFNPRGFVGLGYPMNAHSPSEPSINLAKMKQQHFSTEEVIKVLTYVQELYIQDALFLITEDWDWLVVLQCLQDHGLFKSNPKRLPLSAFEAWMQENNVPQFIAKCSVQEMSLASRELKGERYPWSETHWEQDVLVRWRYLYQILDEKLTEEIS